MEGLTESVRDAADLFLSIRYPPVMFINDTPCGLARHMECRCPNISSELWGNRTGCFKKPTTGVDSGTTTRVKTHKLLQVCKQELVASLFTSCQQVVFALLVPSLL